MIPSTRIWPHLSPAQEASLLRTHASRRGKPVPPGMMQAAIEATRVNAKQRKIRDAVFTLADMHRCGAWSLFAERQPEMVRMLRALVAP